MGATLAQFEGHKYLSIETYKRSGDAVRTPVWFVESNGALFVRTARDTGKFKRIRNNPSVKIAPCGGTGKIMGDWVQAQAGSAQESEADDAYRLLRSKYGLLYAITSRFMKKKYVVLKVTPAGS